jgi:hypothetical protein
MTHYGVIPSILKTTARAIGLALLMAGPASAASVEDPPGAAPGAAPSGPPGAAVANLRADLDGDRIEDALGVRLSASQAGERFDVIVLFDGPGAVGRGRAAAGPFAVTREFSIINGFQAQLTAPQIRGLSRAPPCSGFPATPKSRRTTSPRTTTWAPPMRATSPRVLASTGPG